VDLDPKEIYEIGVSIEKEIELEKKDPHSVDKMRKPMISLIKDKIGQKVSEFNARLHKKHEQERERAQSLVRERQQRRQMLEDIIQTIKHPQTVRKEEMTQPIIDKDLLKAMTPYQKDLIVNRLVVSDDRI
jgi:CHASE3 domain sensor protein